MHGLLERPKLYVLLEFVRSAHNVGSVFRACDSAGITKLFLCGWTAMPPHPKLAKTALGSEQSVAWEHHCSAVQLAVYLRSQSISLVALEVGADSEDIFTAPFERDTCLIFGHEELGVSEELLQLCDHVVAIPHAGAKSSLNVSVAAGVAIYEYVRKRDYETS